MYTIIYSIYCVPPVNHKSNVINIKLLISTILLLLYINIYKEYGLFIIVIIIISTINRRSTNNLNRLWYALLH